MSAAILTPSFSLLLTMLRAGMVGRPRARKN